MSASPVNAGDAQGLQDSFAKVLEEIADAARRAITRMASSRSQESQRQLPKKVDKNDLRIQMGRRVIYGETNKGFRNELTPEHLQNLAQALRQPVTEGASLEDYKNKIPRVQIKVGDEVLFRQERDGAVTVNELSLERQVEQEATAEGKQQARSVELSAIAPEETRQHSEQLVSAQAGQEIQSSQVAASNQDKSLDSDGDGLTNTEELSLGTDPFSTDTDRDGLSDRVDNHNGNNHNTNNSNDLYQGVKQLLDEVYAPNPKPEAANHNTSLNASSDRSAVQEVSNKPPAFVDLDVPPAIRVGSQEIEKAPSGNAKQLFTALVKELGKEAQKVGSQAFDWVATRPEWMRDQNVASTALKLFNDNYTKTGETAYLSENYEVKLQGVNNYQINDRDGKALMSFQKTALGGIKVRENHMMTPDYQQFANVRQSLKQFGNDILDQDSSRRVSLLRGLAPRGDLEVINTLKTKEVMTTASSFLQNMGVERWNAGEKGNYNISRQGNSLKIDSKADGRGTVLLVENDQMLTNKLSSKDFTHFRKLEGIMQKDLALQQQKVASLAPNHEGKQQIQKRASPKKEAGLEL